jgi:hypothetical protein
MFVNGCTHSFRSHFLHPFCLHQTKVTKIALLFLGTVLLYQTYRLLSKRVDDPKNLEEEIKKIEETRIRNKTIAQLENKGSLLSTPTLFHCLNFFSKSLQQLSYQIGPSLRYEVILDQKVEFERFLVIPCLEKGWTVDHITLFLIEKRNDGSYHLEFFDSKGYSIWMNPHARLLKNNITTLYQPASVTDNARWLQRDIYNCAIFLCWYVENRLIGQKPQEMYYLPAPDIEAYRITLAKRLRAQCQTT